jgi:hypothetical protein
MHIKGFIVLPVGKSEETKEYVLAQGFNRIKWIYECTRNEKRARGLTISYIRIEGTRNGSADHCIKCPNVLIIEKHGNRAHIAKIEVQNARNAQ